MKLGPHCLRTTPQALGWAMCAPVVKGVDNIDVLKAAPDSAIRVFRHYFPTQDLDANPWDVAAAILGALGTYRHRDLLVEVYNEIPRQSTAAYASLLQRTVPILHNNGVQVCGPCWATGDYDADHWALMRDFGWCGLDAIGLHAYWGNQGFSRWHALRWRTMWQYGDPPILVTECGRDKVEGGNGGWKRDGISGEQYVAELAAYDCELALDPHVLGAAVFSAGPTTDWDAFSTDDITEQIVAALEAETVATLREQFASDYAAWIAAGGIDNNFETFLVGQGKIQPTREIVKRMAGEVIAKATELQIAVDKLPLG